MGYTPEKHHRRSIRLRGWDYASPGAHFVTICTHNGECLFEDPVLRRVVETTWRRIPRHFPHVRLDEFVVMPNHVHGIIWIVDKPVGAQGVGAQHAAPLHTGHINVAPGSLGAIVRSFKSAVTKRINEIQNTAGTPVWQRNYYEHIVRNEDELGRIREYIRLNPLKWELDRENPNRTGRNPEEDWLYAQRNPTTFHYPRPH